MGIAAVVALTAMACASLPPAKPIADGKMLVETWKGSVSTSAASYDYTLTIKEDGTYLATSPTQRPLDGTWRLVDGGVVWRSNSTGRTGIGSLHEGNGRQVLRFLSGDGVSGEFTR